MKHAYLKSRPPSSANKTLRFFCFMVFALVPPDIYAWVECKGEKMVAVCKAEKGNPAANISWSHTGNSTLLQTASEGFYTVESRVELSEDTDTKNLSCAVRHPYWNEERTLSLQCSAGQISAGYNCILYSSGICKCVMAPNDKTSPFSLCADYLLWLYASVAAVIIMFLAAISFFAQKKLRLLR